MRKAIIFTAVLAFLMLTRYPAMAQKRIAITGSERHLPNSSIPNTIEPSLHAILLGNGYLVATDTTAADLKIRYSASCGPGNSTGGFSFVYVNAEVALIDMKLGKETQHLVFSGIKGGGVNPEAASQKAFQTAARKISDTLSQLLKNSGSVAANLPAIAVTATVQPSDVDLNIPSTALRNDNIYALIIGNEDYKSFQQGLNDEVNVEFAIHDATVFKSYVNKTLGVPEENIRLLLNARSIDMHRELKKLVSYIKALTGSAEIIVFYAGHGLPDETTKEPYLIPVDVVGTDLQFAVKLTGLYSELTAFPAKKVTIFIDACFTGGARNQGLIAARGVKVKPKTDALSGNIVVFSASSGDQSSLAYKDKGHGMFTYYLLKKIQESRGNISYKNLADYLSREVSVQSVRVNNKDQNPQVSVSEDVRDQWESWMLKD